MKTTIPPGRLARLLLASLAAVAAFGIRAADALDFAHRPLLAGKASLAGPGFEVTRTLGVAAFAPCLLSTDGVPVVRDRPVLAGEPPRILALYDPSWWMRDVRARVGGAVALPPRGRGPRLLVNSERWQRAALTLRLMLRG